MSPFSSKGDRFSAIKLFKATEHRSTGTGICSWVGVAPKCDLRMVTVRTLVPPHSFEAKTNTLKRKTTDRDTGRVVRQREIRTWTREAETKILERNSSCAAYTSWAIPDFSVHKMGTNSLLSKSRAWTGRILAPIHHQKTALMINIYTVH